MTKELFLKYEAIRKSGEYNMFMDASQAMAEMGMNPSDADDRKAYFDIIQNYAEFAKRWL